MRSEDMIDATLAGPDTGERVTTPPIQDSADWEQFENACSLSCSNIAIPNLVCII